MPEPRSPRLAVLIDADNTSPKVADGLFTEIAKIGEASVRRIYGDFASPRLKGWSDILAKHAIVPHQQFAYTSGKNASDITLVIDAMDLLHTGRFDGFCLVSSDSDFTRLASRIREQGIDVFGFGEQRTPLSFRQACRRFIYIENLMPAARAEAPARAMTPAAIVAARRDAKPAPAPAPAPASAARSLEPPQAALPLLLKVVEQLEGEDGWVSLGMVGTRLIELFPDFDSRTYGFRKLSDLVRKLDAFETGNSESALTVRRRRPEPERPAPERFASEKLASGKPAPRTAASRASASKAAASKAANPKPENSKPESLKPATPGAPAARKAAPRRAKRAPSAEDPG